MIQIDVRTTFCQEEGIVLQKYRDRNGRRIAVLFKSIRVGGPFDSPDVCVCVCVGGGSKRIPHNSHQISQNGQKFTAEFF